MSPTCGVRRGGHLLGPHHQGEAAAPGGQEVARAIDGGGAGGAGVLEPRRRLEAQRRDRLQDHRAREVLLGEAVVEQADEAGVDLLGRDRRHPRSPRRRRGRSGFRRPGLPACRTGCAPSRRCRLRSSRSPPVSLTIFRLADLWRSGERDKRSDEEPVKHVSTSHIHDDRTGVTSSNSVGRRVTWTVETLGPAVDAEIAALPTDMQAAFLRLGRAYRSFGMERIGSPHVNHLQGKLWEMRFGGRDGIARAMPCHRGWPPRHRRACVVKKTRKPCGLGIGAASGNGGSNHDQPREAS